MDGDVEDFLGEFLDIMREIRDELKTLNNKLDSGVNINAKL